MKKKAPFFRERRSVVTMCQNFGQIAFHDTVLHRKAQRRQRRIQHGILTFKIEAGVIQPIGADRADNGVENGVGFFIYVRRIFRQRQELVHNDNVAVMMKTNISARFAVQKGVQRLDLSFFIFRIGFDN